MFLWCLVREGQDKNTEIRLVHTEFRTKTNLIELYFSSLLYCSPELNVNICGIQSFFTVMDRFH